MKKVLLFVTLLTLAFISKAQNCYDSANVYQFFIDNKKYELVKELKSWDDAAACAVDQGGYLVHINSQSEQDSVYHHVAHLSGIDTAYINVYDAGNVAYVWIGGTDAFQENSWIWDGNTDNVGVEFWYGIGYVEDPIDGMYQNWGTKTDGTIWEPDNYSNQDGAAMGLEKWPNEAQYPNVQYGTPGQWNDIGSENEIYYVIEYELNGNVVPCLNAPIQDFDTISNTYFEIHIPDSIFFDADGNETLTFSATLNNGDPLPGWLTFDSVQVLFSGTAPVGDTLIINVLATDAEGANVWDTFELRIENNASSIQQIQKDELEVYPNPASGWINIKSKENIIDSKFEIVDFQGRLYQSGIVKFNTIEISEIPQGIYLLKIITPNNRFVNKIAIQ